ncbi:MAG: hypothetical protein RI911_220 [Candidatus Parcubacteria bacterium]|jgi:hypothetical protein
MLLLVETNVCFPHAHLRAGTEAAVAHAKLLGLCEQFD